MKREFTFYVRTHCKKESLKVNYKVMQYVLSHIKKILEQYNKNLNDYDFPCLTPSNNHTELPKLLSEEMSIPVSPRNLENITLLNEG